MRHLALLQSISLEQLREKWLDLYGKEPPQYKKQFFIDAGKIEVIVVYKVDRLSRSLLDFMKMIGLFNEKGVSFVSVTLHFSTTDPTGRMFLVILITFAQYEREVIAYYRQSMSGCTDWLL